MKKLLIALRGRSHCGKTTTIRIAHDLLLQQYLDAHEDYLKTGSIDVSVILTIDGVNVGIASKGDPKTQLRTRLQRLRDRDCWVVLCATRTRGATVSAVTDLQRDGYTISWHDQVVNVPSKRESGNRKMAAEIVAEVNRTLQGFRT